MSNDACARWELVISEWIDGTVDPTHASGIEQHLVSCDRCRRVVDDLTEITRSAAHLRPLAPPAVVWDRLARQIGQMSISIEAGPFEGSSRGRRVGFATTRWFEWFGLAAAGTAAVFLLAVWLNAPRQVPLSPRADVESPSLDSVLTRVGVELETAQQQYEQMFVRLTGQPEGWNTNVETGIETILRENLALIDAAMLESQVVLDAEPDSEVVRRSLIEATRQKAAVLQHAVAATTRMTSDIR